MQTIIAFLAVFLNTTIMPETNTKPAAPKSFVKPQMTPELKENQKIYEEYYDRNYTKLISDNIMKPIDNVWFRSELIGFDNYPEREDKDTPVIFASNHSGMAFPWDAMVFGYKINQIHNFNEKSIRALASPMLSKTALMNPFVIINVWKRVGSIDATFLNFETMMYYNKQNILIYPEGVPGIGKGFNNRYKLQEVKTSMVRMSIKYHTPIVPYYTINGEYINPYTYSSDWVNRMVNKIGIPFLPLGVITFFLIIQPWIFFIGFPANLRFVLGKKIKPYEWTNKPYEEITQEEFREMASKIHTEMQAGLTAAEQKYGQKPYNWKTFFKSAIRHYKDLLYVLPLSWPMLFTEFNKQYLNGKKDMKVRANIFSLTWYMIKNPITLAFFIPVLGWIPIGIYNIVQLQREAKKKKSNKQNQHQNS